MTVSQYATRFRRLSKYCLRLIDTEEHKTRQFIKGLRPDLQRALAPIPPLSYSVAVEAATRTENSEKMLTARGQGLGLRNSFQKRPNNKKWQGRQNRFQKGRNIPQAPHQPEISCTFCGKWGHQEAHCRRKNNQCIACGSSDHFIQSCPHSNRQPQGTTGAGPLRIGAPTANKPGRPPVRAKVFAMEKKDINEDSNVVEGTLFISTHEARILIDPGSTHSFIAPHFAKCLHMSPTALICKFLVSTPIGDTLIADMIYPECEIYVDKILLPGNLIELPFKDYDVILGMDWLSRHFAQLDCRTKIVKFDLPEGMIQFQGIGGMSRNSIISGIKARKLLRKGCQGFLAYLMNHSADIGKIEAVPVVKEYTDVFPSE